MANQSLASAINYFAVFRVGEVDRVDTAQNYAKRSATLHGAEEYLFPFSLLFWASLNLNYAISTWYLLSMSSWSHPSEVK